MKVIIVSGKNEFDQQHLELIQKRTTADWITTEETNFDRIISLYSGEEEKIFAFSPVPFSWKIPDNLYAKLKMVKYICLPTSGFDFINLEKCKKHNIAVTNTPHYSTNAVAEYAMFMFLALLKRLPIQIKSLYKYEFTQETMMDEIKGKTAGIIGLGHIGLEIAALAESLGMKVCYWSKHKKQTRFLFMELPALIRSSNVIFPALAVNKETIGLLDKKALSGLRTDSYVVNIMHGVDSSDEVLDNKYLIQRAESNILGGFAFESSIDKLTGHKGNIFITAPMAWYTKQSLAKNIELWTKTILSCLSNKPINVINVNSISI